MAASKRLSPKEWAEAGSFWESGEYTLEQLATRYDVAKETLSRKFSKLGRKKGSSAEQHAESVKEKLTESRSAEAAVTATRIRETKENHYNWASGLGRMAMHKMAQATKDKQPVATILPDLKAIEKAMVIVQKSRQECYSILGLDKEDFVDDETLPDLLIAEMTADEIEHMRQQQMDDTLGITDDESDDGVIEEGLGDDNDVVEEGMDDPKVEGI